MAIGCARIVATYDVFATTADEPGHIASAVEYTARHTYKLDPQHPPLARLMIGLPLVLDGVRPQGNANWQHEGWAVITYRNQAERTLFLARLGNLPFFVLAGLVVFLWARRYFGPVAALFGTLLFTLTPPVLAHAGLATTDSAITACLGMAFLAAVEWARQPDLRRSILFGLAAGVVALAKFTALIYYPAGLALALLCYLAIERPGGARLKELAAARLRAFAVAVAVGTVVIWAGYLFTFGKPALWSSSVPLPAPDLFDGLRILLEHNRGGHASYLFGTMSLTGFWYYFPVALAVKTPLALLLLVAGGLWLAWRRRTVPALLPVAFAAGVLLPAMAGNINIGVRHVLPMYVAFAVLGGMALDELLASASARRWSLPAAGVAVLWLAGAGAAAHPDYIPYFNELVRHPDEVLVDSDYDWGQDNKRLALRLRQLGATSVNFDNVLSQDMEFLQKFPGLPPIHPINPLEPAEGWTAVSPTIDRVTQYGLEYRYPNLKPWFDTIEPRERVGTLLLYYVPPGTLRR